MKSECVFQPIRGCSYSIGRDLGSSWLNISDFSKGLCGLPLSTVLNRSVTLWVVYHFCFFSTYRGRDSHSNMQQHIFLLCSWQDFLWLEDLEASPAVIVVCCWRTFCVLSSDLLLATLVLVWVFSYVLYLCDLMEFFFISDLASLCVAAGYRPGTVLGPGRGNWGAMGLRPCQSNLQQYCDTVRAWGETCWHSALKRVGQLMSVEEDTLVMVFLSWNVFCLIALYKVFPSFDMQYLFKTISTHVRDFLQLVNSWWLEKFLFFFF